MTSRQPHATIFADASVCPKTKAAGWGAWMISKTQGSRLRGGSLREAFSAPTEAELAALANALYVAGREGYLAEGATIMLQSDSANALSMIRHHLGAADRPMKDAQQGVTVPIGDPKCWCSPSKDLAWDRRLDQRRRLLGAIQEQAKAFRLTLVVRHVRGHRGRDAGEGDGRAWVNVQVDRLAREGMRVARRALQKEGENV